MNINCSYQLFHVWGPFSIHSYGLFIAVGIIVSMFFASYNHRFTYLKLEHYFTNIVTIAILSGIFGGRLLEIISHPTMYTRWIDWFALWEGGFSVLGSILGVIALVPFYVKKHAIPIIPLFDLAAIYVPLLQSIARLGCFMAGCCYGIKTAGFLSVTYIHAHAIAPKAVALHPTQLYSSFILLLIFLFMFLFAQYRYIKTGQLFCLYLLLVAAERFIVDFWRAERIMIHGGLSFHQIIALSIICCTLITSALLYTKNALVTKTQ